MPQPAATETALPANPTPLPDTGWLPVAPGIELRRLRTPAAPTQVSIVRIDPTQVRFRVGYRPGAPQSIERWADEAGALAVINGGFFDLNYTTTALLIRDGVAAGESYVGRGGMFSVSPAEAIRLRSLADTPFDPAEPIREAIQGWPLLLRPGNIATYSYEDGDRARRSVIATDQAGRVLLIALPQPTLTLAELSTWLANTDLALDVAVNLDGGSSTGLIVNGDQERERISPFIALPIVLLVLPADR
jgi:hypothetical protein